MALEPPHQGSPAPQVVIRPSAVRENAARITDRFDGRVVGVTKAVAGDPTVASAMLDGGVDGLADSRSANVARHGAQFRVEKTLLVVPMLSEVDRVVRTAERSLNSEVETLRALSAAAQDAGVEHRAIVMVDIGDRREGVLPDDVVPTLERVVDLPQLEVVGLGTNVGCFGGVIPTASGMEQFVEVVEEAEDALGREFPVVSGGSSVTLPLVEDGRLPGRVNELRIGEAILLGTDLTRDRVIPYLRQDAFELRAEVVECKRKPSVPEGRLGHNADGETPEFEDRGNRKRAIVAMGKQDTVPAELRPVDDGVTVLGASSDHTVLDVEDADQSVGVGDVLGFRPGYQALVRAFTSEYVGRVTADGEGDGRSEADGESEGSPPGGRHRDAG